MDEQLNELLSTLALIALYKSWLPSHLRGWVNALGLYVREHKTGTYTSLQAGGSLRSYIDAWREGKGEWQVRKFDKDTWERRFAHIIEPTFEIAEFLNDRVTYFKDLDTEGASAFKGVLTHYNNTGKWERLPKVSEDIIRTKEYEDAEATEQKEHQNRLRLISVNSNLLKKDPLDRNALISLPELLYKEQKYKDMENALKMRLEADASKLGFQYWSTYKELGKTYLAALSTPSVVRASLSGVICHPM